MATSVTEWPINRLLLAWYHSNNDNYYAVSDDRDRWPVSARFFTHDFPCTYFSLVITPSFVSSIRE